MVSKMRSFECPTWSNPRRQRRGFLNSTYTTPSNNYSGNYEGDVTMFRVTSPRNSDSDEEYSSLNYFNEAENTIETLRNRLFLYQLSPIYSNAILKNSFYQTLIQMNTIFIFLMALIILSAWNIFKRVVFFFIQRRYILYYWINYIMFNLVPITSALVISFMIGYCYYICFSSSREIVKLMT
ncbi:uncharacterized protein LOC129908570 [Episyrphus balteatus]|uniref:uncharacterized protein LOC129908570 n=1 Tax=Episyrphus balteatus TaxID=286459 RepID=UPI002485867B|nr:uncharacterized protein LOC129908570 [Episyrphus balteatus]